MAPPWQLSLVLSLFYKSSPMACISSLQETQTSHQELAGRWKRKILESSDSTVSLRAWKLPQPPPRMQLTGWAPPASVGSPWEVLGSLGLRKNRDLSALEKEMWASKP